MENAPYLVSFQKYGYITNSVFGREELNRKEERI